MKADNTVFERKIPCAFFECNRYFNSFVDVRDDMDGCEEDDEVHFIEWQNDDCTGRWIKCQVDHIIDSSSSKGIKDGFKVLHLAVLEVHCNLKKW